jgi:5S rRNA maturation endonuclease (ribonuclease M5)
MKTDFEKLEQTLTELKEDPRPKLVEGPKDRKALSYFGISNIKMVHGNALPEIPVKVQSDVILLLDFDRKGRVLTKKLYDLFKSEGYRADLTFRKELRRLARLNVIEELVARYTELKKREMGLPNRVRKKH